MSHLTDEQFEDALQGRETNSAHLEQCAECRDRLAEKRAIAGRLRSAFASVKADSRLADRIRNQTPTVRGHEHHRLWPTLATAAAILVVIVPLSLYLAVPSSARAAQEELAKIHQMNLGSNPEFYSEGDPEKLAEYLKEKLDFVPAFPRVGQGMEIRGCCVAQFKDAIVGSYVVDTPKGIISVIVVTDAPQSMGMTRMAKDANEQIFWEGSFAESNMVTVRLGDYSYCAVAGISCEYLKDLLGRLLPVAE